MTIGEVSRRSGVSIRTLRHYDSIGLLKPVKTTEAGYRQYDESALQRLSFILLFRELKLPLKEICRLLDDPAFDPVATLNDQITQLEAQRAHIDHLIALAQGIKMKGLKHLTSVTAFDMGQVDEAAERAQSWMDTPAMREYMRRSAELTEEEERANEAGFEQLIASFREHPADPTCPEARRMIQALQDYITAHAYPCTTTVLRYFADYCDGGGEVTRIIDNLAGAGTAAWLAKAMRAFCDERS